MHGIWKDIVIFEINEQCLADQVRVIKSNEWLLKVEIIEEINRNIEMGNISDIDINQSVRDTDGDKGIKKDVAAEVDRITDRRVEQDDLNENTKDTH